MLFSTASWSDCPCHAIGPDEFAIAAAAVELGNDCDPSTIEIKIVEPATYRSVVMVVRVLDALVTITQCVPTIVVLVVVIVVVGSAFASARLMSA